MADSFTANIEGISIANARLRSLGSEYRKKGMKFATRKGANLIRDRAKKKADQFDDGNTPNSVSANVAVRFSSSTFRRTGDVKYRIGILGGAKQPKKTATKGRASDKYLTPKAGAPGGDTFYWRFREFGTRTQRAAPFLRPSIEVGQQQVFTEIGTQLEKFHDRTVKRLAR